MNTYDTLFQVDGASACIDAPLLSAEEEIALAKRIASGDIEAKQELVSRNLRLVFNAASSFLGHGVSHEDLVEEGMLGLMTAAERFDHRRGYRFSTYAVNWIRQAMGVAINRDGRLIRMPANQITKHSEIDRVQRALFQELGRDPTAEEIAEAMEGKYDPGEIRDSYEHFRSPLSLDFTLGEEEDCCLGDIIYREADLTPRSEYELTETQERIQSLLPCLNDREREIIRDRYGFNGESKSLSELAEIHHISRERVRQIEMAALEKMRNFQEE